MKTANAPRLAGFTLVEIMIVVAVIGLLAAIAIPNFVRARATSQVTACINNMRQIDCAIQQVSMEKNLHTGDTIISGDLTPYIKLNSASSIPGCPANGIYEIQPVGSTPSVVCSLSTLSFQPHILQ